MVRARAKALGKISKAKAKAKEKTRARARKAKGKVRAKAATTLTEVRRGSCKKLETAPRHATSSINVWSKSRPDSDDLVCLSRVAHLCAGLAFPCSGSDKQICYFPARSSARCMH